MRQALWLSRGRGPAGPAVGRARWGREPAGGTWPARTGQGDPGARGQVPRWRPGEVGG